MTHTTIALDEALVEPIVAHEGESPVYEIIVPDVQTGITSPTMSFYKVNTGSDLSATYLTGSMSVSGIDHVITKTFQNLKAGFWVFNVYGTVDGISRLIVKQPLIVKRANEV